jgi:hypothetical protein
MVVVVRVERSSIVIGFVGCWYLHTYIRLCMRALYYTYIWLCMRA